MTVDCASIESNASCGLRDHHAINKPASDTKGRPSSTEAYGFVQTPAKCEDKVNERS